MPASPPLGNISGEVSVQELLSNNQLIPGLRGATLKVEKGTAIRFADIFQLTINHGVEFLLTREVRRTGRRIVAIGGFTAARQKTFCPRDSTIRMAQPVLPSPSELSAIHIRDRFLSKWSGFSRPKRHN